MVSSVLGKQFSNIHASLGLVSRALILAISDSTASDRNRRASLRSSPLTLILI